MAPDLASAGGDLMAPGATPLPGEHRKHVRLTGSAALYAAVVAGLLLFIVGGYLFYRGELRAAHREVHENLEAVSTLKLGQILQWRRQRIGDAADVASRQYLADAVDSWLRRPEESDERAILAELRALQSRAGLSNAMVVDRTGRLRLSSSPTVEQMDGIDYLAIAAASREARPVLTSLHDDGDGEVHIDAVAPLHSTHGEPVGAILLRSAAADSLDPLIRNWPTTARTAETLLVQRDENEVLFLNELRHQEHTALRLRLPLDRTTAPAVQAVLGRTGLFEGIDYRGEPVLSVLRHVPDSPWFLVTKIDTAEAYAGWRMRAGLLLLVMTIVGLVMVASLIWIYRSNAAYRNLVRVEAALRDHQIHLEELVAQRTEELRERNDLLALKIVERKAVEKALLQSQADLNRAQEVGAIGSWRLDVRANQMTWSPETYRIFGVAADTPVDYPAFLRIVHPDDREYVDRRWQAALGGKAYDVEHRLLVAGQIKWVREKAEMKVDEEGCVVGGFGITQDITDIKSMRQALTESEDRFRTFMTHSPVASWILDGEGRFQYVSPVYYQLFGVGSADITGRLIGDIHPDRHAGDYPGGSHRAFEAGQAAETVEVAMRPDGSRGEYLVVTFPMRDASGRPLQGGMALDITERRDVERQLRAANLRLAGLADDQAIHLRTLAADLIRAEQRERDRLYELLHDNVQPLLVAARLALSTANEQTPVPACLAFMVQAREHVSMVIDTARSLSTELSPPLIRERGLGPALDSLCRWMRANYGVDIDFACDPDAEPADVAIRLLCFKAARELLTNAVKHAGTQSLELTLQLDEPGVLRLSVVDGGCGFDAAVRRSHGAVAGSGLSNIEWRLTMVGGRLTVDSAPGAGTSATLLVPCGCNRVLSRPAPAGAAQATGDKTWSRGT